MAEFHVTADRWKVRISDAHTVATYEIEGGTAAEARAEAARRWAAHEDREKISVIRERERKAEEAAAKASAARKPA